MTRDMGSGSFAALVQAAESASDFWDRLAGDWPVADAGDSGVVAGEEETGRQDANSAYRIGTAALRRGDDERAVMWFGVAVEYGHPGAAFRMAVALLRRTGSFSLLSPSEEQGAWSAAWEMLAKAAQWGHGDACRIRALASDEADGAAGEGGRQESESGYVPEDDEFYPEMRDNFPCREREPEESPDVGRNSDSGKSGEYGIRVAADSLLAPLRFVNREHRRSSFGRAEYWTVLEKVAAKRLADFLAAQRISQLVGTSDIDEQLSALAKARGLLEEFRWPRAQAAPGRWPALLFEACPGRRLSEEPRYQEVRCLESLADVRRLCAPQEHQPPPPLVLLVVTPAVAADRLLADYLQAGRACTVGTEHAGAQTPAESRLAGPSWVTMPPHDRGDTRLRPLPLRDHTSQLYVVRDRSSSEIHLFDFTEERGREKDNPGIGKIAVPSSWGIDDLRHGLHDDLEMTMTKSVIGDACPDEENDTEGDPVTVYAV